MTYDMLGVLAGAALAAGMYVALSRRPQAQTDANGWSPIRTRPMRPDDLPPGATVARDYRRPPPKPSPAAGAGVPVVVPALTRADLLRLHAGRRTI
jgi:hypothetical protein